MSFSHASTLIGHGKKNKKMSQDARQWRDQTSPSFFLLVCKACSVWVWQKPISESEKRISASSRRVTCNKHMLMYVCSFWIGHFLSAQIRQLGRDMISHCPNILHHLSTSKNHIHAYVHAFFSPCPYWVYILLYIYSSLLTI